MTGIPRNAVAAMTVADTFIEAGLAKLSGYRPRKPDVQLLESALADFSGARIAVDESLVTATGQAVTGWRAVVANTAYSLDSAIHDAKAALRHIVQGDNNHKINAEDTVNHARSASAFAKEALRTASIDEKMTAQVREIMRQVTDPARGAIGSGGPRWPQLSGRVVDGVTDFA